MIRAGINTIEHNVWNYPKIAFEKINTMYKLLPRMIKKKRESTNDKYIRNKTEWYYRPYRH